MEGANLTPPRVRFINIRSGAGITAQFNPTQFQETVTANYSRSPVLGLSHEILQFVNTANHKFTMELFFNDGITPEIREDRLGDVGIDELVTIDAAKRFFESLLYPAAERGLVSSGAPPRVLVVWPGTLYMTTVLTSLTITNARFNYQGSVVVSTMALQFEEIRDVRITSEEVQSFGSRR